MPQLWEQCVENLSFHISEDDINLWVRPLHAIEKDNALVLLSPNQHGMNWIKNHCMAIIKKNLPENMSVKVGVGSPDERQTVKEEKPNGEQKHTSVSRVFATLNLNPNYTFETFVEGKTNQLACAAAKYIASASKKNMYNPLFIYGGVGLGKTHLMHAIGNEILKNNPEKSVLYLQSEMFVSEMVSAIRNGSMDSFKQKYRFVNMLLIDDVQFFVGKTRSQEEFFHTFNSLFNTGQQIVLTSDRYPKDISGLQERLVSRFVCGLTHVIEPPEYETRVAILSRKATYENYSLPDNVLSFIAKQAHSSVRELEGALQTVITCARFSDMPITLSFAKDALKDLVSSNSKTVSIALIQKKTCEYFNVRTSDLISPKRSQSIVRPRQMAMTLARELTSYSFPEIGEEFNGRDHTTVINACRRIKALREKDPKINEDYQILLRTIVS